MFELSAAHEEVSRLSRLLDNGLAELRSSAEKVAEAERAYRRARGLSWVEHSSGTAAFRESQVDAATAELRFARDMAEGVRRAAVESIRSRNTQISVLQTLINAHKAEANFERTGPGRGFDDNRYPA